MKYIHIRNLEKYQPGYKDRKLYWVKIYSDMIIGDENCESLSEIGWSRLVKLIVMETTRQKPTPIERRFLSGRGFDLDLYPIDVTLNELNHFIQIIDENESQPIENINVTETSQKCNENVEISLRRVDKSRVDKSIYMPSNYFKKPNLEDLKALFREKGFPAEAEKFFDYYESNGWRVGKNPMRKWQSAVANWIRQSKSFGTLESKPKERKPDPLHEACAGSGKLPDSKPCWCWK